MDVVAGNRERSAPRRYVDQAVRTISVLRHERPQSVVVMLPPLPALITTLLGRRRGSRVVADLHTGVFNDPRWSWALRLTLRLARRHAVIVTNGHLADESRRRGVRAFQVHDVLSRDPGPGSPGERNVMCPLSFASDEPVDAIIDAARALPDTRWWVTGRAPADLELPPNVRLTGYVSDEEFWRLMGRANVVLALTTRPHTMQRAGYEALMRLRPLVTSDEPVLREFHEDSAVYTDLTAAAIAAAVRECLRDERLLVQRADRVLATRMGEQEEALRELRDHLGSSIPRA
ncbi:glycosyltransferase [Geodermatophilus amargosae]|uniref:glycosyltransferase n=1 Tax=Geodermatophilus amargosae TaxID=1296565 RepID=UPI0034DE1E3E